MRPFFYGWVITACAFGVLFLSYGVQYSFGVFVPAIVADLGWSQASLGAAFSLYSIVYTVFTSVSGKLTDALGPRRVIAMGGVLLGGGLFMTSRMQEPGELYLWYGLVAALGMSTAYIPCNMTVVRWFQRRRGLALGLASIGASSGILLLPLLAHTLIATHGWRSGLAALALALAAVALLAARFMLARPEMMGLAPDGDSLPANPAVLSAPRVTTRSFTLGEALHTPAFWILLTAFALTMMTIGVPFVHVASHARDLALPATAGAVTVSIVGGFAIVSNLLLGAASDRIGRKAAIVIAYAAQVVAFVIFWRAGDAPALYLGAAAFGVFYGGFASLFPALVGDLYGPANGGAIAGALIAGGGLLGGWGPAAAGYLRDSDGDFLRAFSACAIAAALAVVLFVVLPQPRPAHEPHAAGEQ